MRYFLIIFIFVMMTTSSISMAAQSQLLEYDGIFSDSKPQEKQEQVPMLEIPVIAPEPGVRDAKPTLSLELEEVVPSENIELTPEQVETLEQLPVPQPAIEAVLPEPAEDPAPQAKIQESVLPMAESFEEEKSAPDLSLQPKQKIPKPIAPPPEQERPRNTDPVIIRDFVWGVPPDMIKRFETVPLFGEEENTLFYVDKMWGLKSLIGYEFSGDRLWRIRVYNEEKYIDLQKRIDDILMIQTELEKKYGKPSFVDFKWLNIRERNHPSFWGAALFRGDLRITVQWDMPDMMVALSAFAPEIKKPQIVVDYINKGQQTEPQFKKLF